MVAMLSLPIQGLLERLKNQKKTPIASSRDEAYINVNKITEKAGALYEKLRYMVDYKDERHIRRSAIERIVKRKIVFEGSGTFGFSLIQELIAGGYLANNSVAESVKEEVENIIQKYVHLQRYFSTQFARDPRSKAMIVSLMSSEIEAFFYPNNEDEIVADAFALTVESHVKIPDELSSQNAESEIRLACYRSLLNTDDETLRYILWIKRNPNWGVLADESEIQAIGSRAEETLTLIQAELDDALSFKLMPRLGN